MHFYVQNKTAYKSGRVAALQSPPQQSRANYPCVPCTVAELTQHKAGEICREGSQHAD